MTKEQAQHIREMINDFRRELNEDLFYDLFLGVTPWLLCLSGWVAFIICFHGGK